MKKLYNFLIKNGKIIDCKPIESSSNSDKENQKIVDEINECFADDIYDQPILIQHRADSFFKEYSKRLR